MASESIVFPEELIPQIVALLRRGLQDEENARVHELIEFQCKTLEIYWKRCQEPSEL